MLIWGLLLLEAHLNVSLGKFNSIDLNNFIYSISWAEQGLIDLEVIQLKHLVDCKVHDKKLHKTSAEKDCSKALLLALINATVLYELSRQRHDCLLRLADFMRNASIGMNNWVLDALLLSILEDLCQIVHIDQMAQLVIVHDLYDPDLHSPGVGLASIGVWFLDLKSLRVACLTLADEFSTELPISSFLCCAFVHLYYGI